MHRWMYCMHTGMDTGDAFPGVGWVATYLGAVHAQVDMYGDRGLHYLG